MIGKLRFKVGAKTVVAVLHEGVRWTCGEPQIETYLNEVCVHDGGSALHLLYQTAERLGAEVVSAAHEHEACAG